MSKTRNTEAMIYEEITLTHSGAQISYVFDDNILIKSNQFKWPHSIMGSPVFSSHHLGSLDSKYSANEPILKGNQVLPAISYVSLWWLFKTGMTVIFFISPWKHMLWPLIRTISMRCCSWGVTKDIGDTITTCIFMKKLQHVFLRRNKGNSLRIIFKYSPYDIWTSEILYKCKQIW